MRARAVRACANCKAITLAANRPSTTTTPPRISLSLPTQRARGVPVDAYGAGGAKSVADLFEEVALGESALGVCAADGRPERRVSVVSLDIVADDDDGADADAAAIDGGAPRPRRPRRVLREVRQRLPDGRERARGLPLSEKMRPGERWQDAALRGVEEELGGAPLPPRWRDAFKLDEASYTCTERVLEASPSYPGLRSLYSLHRARARLPGCLPAGPFRTEEVAEARPGGGGSGGGGVLVTWWEWRDDEEEAEGEDPFSAQQGGGGGRGGKGEQ